MSSAILHRILDVLGQIVSHAYFPSALASADAVAIVRLDDGIRAKIAVGQVSVQTAAWAILELRTPHIVMTTLIAMPIDASQVQITPDRIIEGQGFNL